jgi:hypothetical protein
MGMRCSGERWLSWFGDHLCKRVEQLARCGCQLTGQRAQRTSWGGPLASPQRFNSNVPAGWNAPATRVQTALEEAKRSTRTHARTRAHAHMHKQCWSPSGDARRSGDGSQAQVLTKTGGIKAGGQLAAATRARDRSWWPVRCSRHCALSAPGKGGNRVCTRLSSSTQWLWSGEGNKGRLCFKRIPRGGQAKRASGGEKPTEPAAGKPLRLSGRHLEQQRRVPEQELPAHSAADHLKWASFAAIDQVSSAGPVPRSSRCRSTLWGGGWLASLSRQRLGMS